MTATRNPQNRIKSWTGTVHFATESGYIACGPVKTSAAYLNWTVEDVTCARCIKMFGADEVTGQTDPEPGRDANIVRRETERAARRASRSDLGRAVGEHSGSERRLTHINPIPNPILDALADDVARAAKLISRRGR